MPCHSLNTPSSLTMPLAVAIMPRYCIWKEDNVKKLEKFCKTEKFSEIIFKIEKNPCSPSESFFDNIFEFFMEF
jgi:hypothetical protein